MSEGGAVSKATPSTASVVSITTTSSSNGWGGYILTTTIVLSTPVICPAQTISISGSTIVTGVTRNLSYPISEYTTPTTTLLCIQASLSNDKGSSIGGTVTFASSYTTYGMSVDPSSVGIVANTWVKIWGYGGYDQPNGVFPVISIKNTSPYQIIVNNPRVTSNYVAGGYIIGAYYVSRVATTSSGVDFMNYDLFYDRLNRFAGCVAYLNIKTPSASSQSTYVQVAPYDPITDTTDYAATVAGNGTGSIIRFNNNNGSLTIDTSPFIDPSSKAFDIEFSICESGTNTVYKTPRTKFSGCNPNVDFIFANTTTCRTVVVLPPVSTITNGRMLYIKDKKNNASVRNVIIQPSFGDSIDNKGANTPVTLNLNSSCITLYTGKYNPTSSLQYLIANIYPSNNQPQLSTFTRVAGDVVSGRNYSRAELNSVNFYSTDDLQGLRKGNTPLYGKNNFVALPTVSKPASCAIIFSGKGDKASGNYLGLDHSNPIDAVLPGKDNLFSYIWSDSTYKNTGVYLISDGTNWYIVGWYQTVGWSWENTTGGTAIPNASKTTSLITNVWGSGVVGTAWSYSIAAVDPNNYNTHMLIHKNTTQNSNLRLTFSSPYATGSTSLGLNNGINATGTYTTSGKQSMFYNQSNNQREHAYWFIGRPIGSGFVVYYPLICYTPQ